MNDPHKQAKNVVKTANKKTTQKHHQKKTFTLKQLLNKYHNYFTSTYLDARLEKNDSTICLYLAMICNYIVIIGCFFSNYGIYFGFQSGVPAPKDVIFFILNFLLVVITILLVSYIEQTGNKPTATSKSCVTLGVFIYLLIFAMSVFAILLFNNNYVHIIMPTIMIINLLITLIFYEKSLAKAEKVQIITTISKDLKHELKS